MRGSCHRASGGSTLLAVQVAVAAPFEVASAEVDDDVTRASGRRDDGRGPPGVSPVLNLAGLHDSGAALGGVLVVETRERARRIRIHGALGCLAVAGHLTGKRSTRRKPGNSCNDRSGEQVLLHPRHSLLIDDTPLSSPQRT